MGRSENVKLALRLCGSPFAKTENEFAVCIGLSLGKAVLPVHITHRSCNIFHIMFVNRYSFLNFALPEGKNIRLK
jgi:hypothetical protein